ncbi:MAG TPA: DUF2802 domain-containing protein [Rhodocyclaceae bacterium]|nr:DUF2802 domain-containing protein [Rhodocyclaceae bacterium]
MGLRELAVTLIVVLALYLLSLLWRLLRLGNKAKRGRPALHEPFGPAQTIIPGLPPIDHDVLMDDELNDEPSELADDDAHVHFSSDSVRNRAVAEPDASSFSFDALLEMRQTHHVVDTLRNEQAAMQEEIARLRAEVAELNAKLSSELRTTAHVSPLYDEAVGLARRGMDVQAIAERCGISVSEAELVRALAASSQSGGREHG